MSGISIGSLFSGIGGLELGLERALGARTLWQIEQDPFCQRVLARHWPDATRYDDVRTATALPVVDVMCGGFPCQDISIAGKGAGLAGARSGLWTEFARLIGEGRPRVVVVENVAALAGRGLDIVITTLADLGYVGSWNMVSAASVGAPHLRRRLFIVAADADRVGVRSKQWWGEAWSRARKSVDAGAQGIAADADGAGCEECDPAALAGTEGLCPWGPDAGWCGWLPASPVRRVDDGIPEGVDRPRRRRPAPDRHRIKALGNAVVPQVAEVVGHVVKDLL